MFKVCVNEWDYEVTENLGNYEVTLKDGNQIAVGKTIHGITTWIKMSGRHEFDLIGKARLNKMLSSKEDKEVVRIILARFKKEKA